MTGKQKLILLADDDQEDLELLEEAISSCDAKIQLHTVLNGRLVVEYLDRTPDSDLPCLIVLDYNMPEMNGADVLERICTNPRYENIPKLIWSTSSTSAYIKECMEKGATAYFIKPASHKQLQELARQMLEYCKVSS
jgi:CheY-like chemotaxis protein